MTPLGTKPLAIALLFLGICASLCHGADPTATPTFEYKFDNSPHTYTRGKPDRPTIFPTHTAFVELEWYHREPTTPDLAVVLKTVPGGSVSQLQRDFLKTTEAIIPCGQKSYLGDILRRMNYTRGITRYRLYAVSREDARKMTAAFVEAWLQENNAALKPLLDDYLSEFQGERSRCQQGIRDIQLKLTKGEQKLEDRRAELARSKVAQWNQSTSQAKKALLELNTIRYTQSIELAGLLTRRKAIERHRREVEQKIKSNNRSQIASWQPILINLEQKHIDLMIDLDVAGARRKSALELRKQIEAFLTQSTNLYEAECEIDVFSSSLMQFEISLEAIEKLLTRTEPALLPLQIHNCPVHIRPVNVLLEQ